MPERGIYKVKVVGRDEATSRDLRESLEREFEKGNPLEGVQELKKTPEEAQAFAGLNQALGAELQNLGLEPRSFPIGALHILASEEYINKAQSTSTDDGIFRNGHIYIPRFQDPTQYIGTLSHEMVHGVSLNAETLYYDEQIGNEFVALKHRTGFESGLIHRSKSERKSDFVGLDEALVEWFSTKIREQYYKGLGKNVDDVALTGVGSYVPHVMVMERVCELLGDDNVERVRDAFFRGLITGDMSILKELEKSKSGLVKILRTMGKDDEDALVAARKLGFHDLEEEYNGLPDREAA